MAKSAEDKVYIDLQALIEQERPSATRLGDLTHSRIFLKAEEETTIIARKNADTELTDFFESFEVDAMYLLDESGEDVIIELVGSKSAGSWDKKYLESILTPDQLEKAYKPGTSYTYIRTSDTPNRIAAVKKQLGVAAKGVEVEAQIKEGL